MPACLPLCCLDPCTGACLCGPTCAGLCATGETCCAAAAGVAAGAAVCACIGDCCCNSPRRGHRQPPLWQRVFASCGSKRRYYDDEFVVYGQPQVTKVVEYTVENTPRGVTQSRGYGYDSYGHHSSSRYRSHSPQYSHHHSSHHHQPIAGIPPVGVTQGYSHHSHSSYPPQGNILYSSSPNHTAPPYGQYGYGGYNDGRRGYGYDRHHRHSHGCGLFDSILGKKHHSNYPPGPGAVKRSSSSSSSSSDRKKTY